MRKTTTLVRTSSSNAVEAIDGVDIAGAHGTTEEMKIAENGLMILSESDTDMSDSETEVAELGEKGMGEAVIVLSDSETEVAELGEKGMREAVIVLSDSDLSDVENDEVGTSRSNAAEAVDSRDVTGAPWTKMKIAESVLIILSDSDTDMSDYETEAGVNIPNLQDGFRGPVLAPETTHEMKIARKGMRKAVVLSGTARKGKRKAAVLSGTDIERGVSTLLNLDRTHMVNFAGCRMMEGNSSSRCCQAIGETGPERSKQRQEEGSGMADQISETGKRMAKSLYRDEDLNDRSLKDEPHLMSLPRLSLLDRRVDPGFRTDVGPSKDVQEVALREDMIRVLRKADCFASIFFNNKFSTSGMSANPGTEFELALSGLVDDQVRLFISCVLSAEQTILSPLTLDKAKLLGGQNAKLFHESLAQLVSEINDRVSADDICSDFLSREDRLARNDRILGPNRAFLNLGPELYLSWPILWCSDYLNSSRPRLKCPGDWVPSRQPNIRKKRLAKSLGDMALETLCSNIRFVESLGGLSDTMKNQISTCLCSRNWMTPDVFRLYIASGPVQIVVPDCSQINEGVFVKTFGKCSTLPPIEVLELPCCGQGLSDYACEILVSCHAASLRTLHTLILTEAEKLTDNGLIPLLRATPHLTTLKLNGCTSISAASIEVVAMSSTGPRMKALSLDSCSQLDPTKTLKPILKRMGKLESLSLSEHFEIVDVMITDLAATLGSSLRKLSISDCDFLTNTAIKAISAFCPLLEVLDISYLSELTDAALASLSRGCGRRYGRQLKTLRLDHGNFSDKQLATFIVASGHCLTEVSVNRVMKVGNLTISSLAEYSNETLEQLNMACCRNVSEKTLGFLADSCSSLREIQLIGCTQVTDVFLEGHSNSRLTVVT